MRKVTHAGQRRALRKITSLISVSRFVLTSLICSYGGPCDRWQLTGEGVVCMHSFARSVIFYFVIQNAKMTSHHGCDYIYRHAVVESLAADASDNLRDAFHSLGHQSSVSCSEFFIKDTCH